MYISSPGIIAFAALVAYSPAVGRLSGLPPGYGYPAGLLMKKRGFYVTTNSNWLISAEATEP
jgi:hypothetical protein